MTLIEAIKSGRPFKRKESFEYYTEAKRDTFRFYAKDILADDWVLAPEVMEFDCTWAEYNGPGGKIIAPSSRSLADLRPLLGQTTKVRVEIEVK